jgi:aminomethyltransferase
LEQYKVGEMRTALFEKHCELGAKIIEFAGWEMPLQYKGITQEHLAVRNNAGIFDVSHMGRIQVLGNEAEQLLDYLSTNLIQGKPELSATYTVWPNGTGGCIDDLIVYKHDPHHFFVVVNASNRQKDLEHLKKYS